jgi:hypothetical protein
MSKPIINQIYRNEYFTWHNMKTRIFMANEKDYPYYQGRGIDMDPRWKKSFMCFYLDMGPKPGKEYSIERIDNDKGYWKWNCKWATNIEQQRNKRNYKGLQSCE